LLAYVHGDPGPVPTCHVTVPESTSQQVNGPQVWPAGRVIRLNATDPDQNIFIPPATSAVPLNVPVYVSGRQSLHAIRLVGLGWSAWLGSSNELSVVMTTIFSTFPDGFARKKSILPLLVQSGGCSQVPFLSWMSARTRGCGCPATPFWYSIFPT